MRAEHVAPAAGRRPPAAGGGGAIGHAPHRSPLVDPRVHPGRSAPDGGHPGRSAPDGGGYQWPSACSTTPGSSTTSTIVRCLLRCSTDGADRSGIARRRSVDGRRTGHMSDRAGTSTWGRGALGFRLGHGWPGQLVGAVVVAGGPGRSARGRPRSWAVLDGVDRLQRERCRRPGRRFRQGVVCDRRARRVVHLRREHRYPLGRAGRLHPDPRPARLRPERHRRPRR